MVAVAAVCTTGVGLERDWQGGSFALAATGLATALPLAVRRTRPVLTAALVGLALVLQVVVGGSLHFGSFLAALIAMFSVARYVASVRSSALGGALLAAGGLGASSPGFREAPADVVFPLFYFGATWALGRGVRVLEERSARLRELNEVLARDRETSAQLAVAEERIRLARELHDVVAHTVMVMVWQAEAAEELLGRADAARGAGEAVRSIQDAGRRGLADLRSLVGVLREDPEAPVTTPRLDDLHALAGLMSRSGLRVELDVDVPDRTRESLPAELEPALYRVVQECLTNVVRHSQATRAQVCVHGAPGRVRVTVRDEGPRRAEPRPGSGHGIAGMRERLAELGGALTAGRHAEGYLVEAVVPIPGGPA